MLINKNIPAFTLAEVLITLGIIGVVTAITIPTLIQKYNTKTWNTAATVFEKKLEDALKIMNSQSTLAGHNSTEEFIEELSTHFKTNKICQNDELLDCFSNIIYWGNTSSSTPKEFDASIIREAKNFGQQDWKSNVIGVQFASGVNALIAYNPTESCTQNPHSNQVTGNDCLAILYDTSGKKNPNTSGKDIRANSSVIKLGTGCAFKTNNTCYTSLPFKPTAVTKAECEEMVASGEYGIKACSLENDYWAGAVKQCGGVDKLPSDTQLAELATYIYGMNVGTSGTVYCPKDANGNYIKCRDESKSQGMGFPSSTYYVFSNLERNATSAYTHCFYPTYTYKYYGHGRGSSFYTLCVDN